MCLSVISCHPRPTFLGKRHPSRNTAVLIALAGYFQIKLRSSVGGNRSFQCFWVSSNSREQDGASLSRYPPRMSGSCNGAKSSHNRTGSMLDLRDRLEHREKPNPSSQVSSAGVPMLPAGTVPKNPLLTPNLFPFLLPGRGAVLMGRRSCDSTGYGDTRCMEIQVCGDTGARGDTSARGDTDAWGHQRSWGHGCSWHGLNPAEPGTGGRRVARACGSEPAPAAAARGAPHHRRDEPPRRCRVPPPHEPSPLPAMFLREPPVSRVTNFSGMEFP